MIPFIIAGIVAGTITGLIPGIHINLIATLIFALTPTLTQITTPLNITITIVAMAITHTFLDVIPATYLGAPDADTAIAALPAHQLLKKGRAYEAIVLATTGSFTGAIITLALSPLLITITQNIYTRINWAIPYILAAACILLITKEKHKLKAIIIFSIAATAGCIILTMQTTEPLFPLFSGLFGISGLLLSLQNKTKLPRQTTIVEKIRYKKTLASATAASCLAGFLPGIGAAQAAVIADAATKEQMQPRQYLILVGAINTMVMMLSFIAIYTIAKARNGAVITIAKVLPEITLQTLLTYTIAITITIGIATLLTLFLAKVASKIIEKINYQKLCIATIVIITMLVAIIAKPLGLIILLTATGIGLLAPLHNVARSQLMACLIVPTMMYLI